MSNAQPQPNAVAKLEPPRLPYPITAINHGIDESMWQTLVTATFPNAATAEGVLLALSYCKARNLDVFKRPVHIVPIYTKIKTPDGKEYFKTIESIWPGINELRITAFRTGAYGGCDPASFGPDMVSEWELSSGGDEPHPNAPPEEKKEAKPAAAKKMLKVTHPEWCQVTVYRLIEDQRIAFPGPRVYWLETYATSGKSDRPNQMWQDRARGQLEKCAEAAALRKAFPEELSSEYTIDEAPRMVDITPAATVTEARPDRSEIETKKETKPRKAEHKKPDVVEEKADGRTGNDGASGEESGATADPAVSTSAPTMSEELEHALATLVKLTTTEELEGAKASLKQSLSQDEFVVWHTAALERHRQLKGRK